MIELEKDMGNLRSGLKSVESVSHKDLRENSRYVTITLFYSVYCRNTVALSFFSPLDVLLLDHIGAGVPEEATAGARRQICVGGESVHHRGQLQLLRCGGLAHRDQRAGKSRRLLQWI